MAEAGFLMTWLISDFKNQVCKSKTVENGSSITPQAGGNWSTYFEGENSYSVSN